MTGAVLTGGRRTARRRGSDVRCRWSIRLVLSPKKLILINSIGILYVPRRSRVATCRDAGGAGWAADRTGTGRPPPGPPRSATAQPAHARPTAHAPIPPHRARRSGSPARGRASGAHATHPARAPPAPPQPPRATATPHAPHATTDTALRAPDARARCGAPPTRAHATRPRGRFILFHFQFKNLYRKSLCYFFRASPPGISSLIISGIRIRDSAFEPSVSVQGCALAAAARRGGAARS
jgi:hypothetical protein